MKKYLLFLSLLLILIVQYGCDNRKLSESKAEEIIKPICTQLLTMQVQFKDHSLSPYVNDELEKLRKLGLATYTYIPPGVNRQQEVD